MVMIGGRRNVILFFLLCLGFATACEGPPYLYLTSHGGSNKGDNNNVLVYSRDGCFLGEALDEDSELNELRGMALWGDSMLLANANQDDSKILQFKGACRSLQNLKEFRAIVPQGTPGLDHPYGVVVDGNRFFYVSTQNTNAVLRFFLTTGVPAPLVETTDDEAPAGLFVQFEKGLDDTRGLTFDPRRRLLFVANKKDGVVVFDEEGVHRGRLHADKPISVSYCADRDSILVSEKGSNVVTEWDPDSFERRGKYKDNLLSHPAGLVCHGDSFFVVSQDEGLVLEFDFATGQAWVLVDKLVDVGEQLILSHKDRC